jgi:hypothetical protein
MLQNGMKIEMFGEQVRLQDGDKERGGGRGDEKKE